MKKAITYIILALFIVSLSVAVLPTEGSADSSGLCYIAVNDTLLDLGYAPAYSGSTLYIPMSVLTNFGIYNSYFASSSTALVYLGTSQLYFDMSNGNCYDANGNQYSAATAIYRNGAIYLPAYFTCGHYGISCSYISGVGYGDVVRLNSGAVLSDSQFLDAATSLMISRYNAYYGIEPSPSPYAPAADVTPSPSPSPEIDMGDTAVYISFTGLPDSEQLDALSSQSVRACFFLTADEIAESPDVVRAIAGSGQRIGVLCTGDDFIKEFEHASALIFEACRERTLFIAAAGDAEGCQAAADENGLIFWDCSITPESDVYSSLISLIASSGRRADIRIDCGGELGLLLPDLLRYLSTNKYDVRAFSEVETPLRALTEVQ